MNRNSFTMNLWAFAGAIILLGWPSFAGILSQDPLWFAGQLLWIIVVLFLALSRGISAGRIT